MSGTCGRRPVLPTLRKAAPCEVAAAVKKRNGDPNWWCNTHGQAASGAGGRPLTTCPGAHVQPVPTEDICDLDLADFPGGVACWGASPPTIAYGQQAADVGVHVHARRTLDGPKVIDRSFTIVRATSQGQTVELDEASLLAFMVSSVANQPMVELTCSHCGWVHLDRDAFAVVLHRKHLCNRCGRNFWNTDPTISNPALAVRRLPAVPPPVPPQPIATHLDLNRQSFTAFALWASNPAVLWTFRRPELEGIHVHAWDSSGAQAIDETYGTVAIEGTDIDANLLRLLMAQRALFAEPWRVTSLSCPSCHSPHADLGPAAFHLTAGKDCTMCGTAFTSPGRRLVVSNPLIGTIRDLGL